MKDSYIKGSNDHHDAMVEASKRRRSPRPIMMNDQPNRKQAGCCTFTLQTRGLITRLAKRLYKLGGHRDPRSLDGPIVNETAEQLAKKMG